MTIDRLNRILTKIIVALVIIVAFLISYSCLSTQIKSIFKDARMTYVHKAFDVVKTINYKTDDHIEFINKIGSLDTFEKIRNYLLTIEYERDLFFDYANKPIITHKLKKGDCDDFARLGQFIMDFYQYDTYYVALWSRKKDINPSHAICVFENEDYVGYIDCNFLAVYTKNERISTKQDIINLYLLDGYYSYTIRDVNYNVIKRVFING